MVWRIICVGHAGSLTAVLLLGIFATCTVCAESVSVGFREIGGVAVDAGTQTLSGSLRVSPQGEFVKSGSGTLEIPMSCIDHAAPYEIVVADGTLSLTGSKGNPSTAVPDVVTQDAAFWTDASMLTVGDQVSTWNDRRSGAEWSASVRYRNAPDETPPVVAETNGLRGVYFGGRSGKWMKFQRNGSDAMLGNVHHFFVVHGVLQWWTALLGNTTENRGNGMFTTLNSAGNTVTFNPRVPTPYMLASQRGEYDQRNFGARFFLDGRLVDPYSQSARYGFQLFEGDFLSIPETYDAFFYNGCAAYRNDIPGGDYLCEVILFTHRLCESDRLAVERYLMDKWNLPQTLVKDTGNTTLQSVPQQAHGTGMVRTAMDATVEVTIDAGDESVPLAFAGAGDVVKKGAGSLVLGPSDAVPGPGTFTLEAGDILLRGGLPPPVVLGAGESWSAARYPETARPSSDAKKLSDVTSGVRVAKSVLGGWRAAKTGVCELVSVGVSEEVRSLQVQEGTLRLASREIPSLAIDGGVTASEVYIPNHSFEQPFNIDSNARCIMPANSESNGWYNVGPRAKTQFVDARVAGYSTWFSTDNTMPDGACALMIVEDGRAETDVTVPRAGTYELSFWATSRYGTVFDQAPTDASIKRSLLDVCFAGRAIGRCQVNKSEFVRFRYRFAVTAAEAGAPMRLGFLSRRSHGDCCTIIDDLHLRAVAEPARSDVVKVPGGDFEMNDLVGATSSTPGLPPVFSREMCVEGWTLSLADGAAYTNPTNGYVAVVTPGTYMYNPRAVLYPFADPGCGSATLGFIGNFGRATSGTFTLPKGRWLLRGRLASWPIQMTPIGGSATDFQSSPCVDAVLVRAGGAEYPLGVTMTPRQTAGLVGSHLLETCLWTNVVELAADENVSLRLRQTLSNGCGLLDDLEFVPADAALPERNLVCNPGFEGGVGWSTFTYYTGVTYSTQSTSQQFDHTRDTYAFGYGVYDGDCCARIHNNGGIKTTVAFPAPGLYRFTMHMRCRSDETTVRNPVRVFAVSADGATNDICMINTPYTQNFVAYSRLVHIPAAGRGELCIAGCGVPSGKLDGNRHDTANLTTLVDGVSLFKVDEAEQIKPDLPRTLRISVAEGAKLVLDYPGTNTVAALTLGGVSVRGLDVVDASTCPDFVSGVGALRVVPYGTLMSFK